MVRMQPRDRHTPANDHTTGPVVRAVRSRRAPAFTLLESIIVMIILGLLAAVIVPRVLNVGQRQAEIEAKAVQRLLSVCAEKCDVWGRPVALDYIQDKSRLSGWTQVSDAKATEEATGSARVVWKEDMLVEPVVLDRLRITAALQDGVPLPGNKWRVAFTPGQPRPVVSIELEPKSASDGPRYTITLNPGETVATRAVGGGSGFASRTTLDAARPRSIDLDDTGKGDAKW